VAEKRKKEKMFTIEQIQELAKKVKSGKDFPQLVQDLKNLGVTYYDNYVSDGKTNYFGAGNFSIEGKSKYPAMGINHEGSAEKLKHALKIHQAGETDYPTFCKDAAIAGVEKWRTDMNEMTVTYFDKKNNALVVESIPHPITT
jgi:uncharacterized protein YbcV (DUF1398 family)